MGTVLKAIVLFVVAASSLFSSSSADHCIHTPDITNTKAKLYREIIQDFFIGSMTGYHIIPGTVYKRYEKVMSSKMLSYHNVSISNRRDVIRGVRGCRRSRRFKKNARLMEKSTCSWYLELEVDSYREPSAIAKARCSCRHCHPAVGESRAHAGVCTTVDSYVPVIRWRCPVKPSTEPGPHYYDYFVDVEKVPVGCTCKRPQRGVSKDAE